MFDEMRMKHAALRVVALGVVGFPLLAISNSDRVPPPVTMTAEQDHQRMMELLGIRELRPGANGRDPNAANAANYDEEKANPYPTLPDPLRLENGQRVSSGELWWSQRRAQIVELFDREVYGRMPAVTPKVDWQVVETKRATHGEVPVITKQLVGRVDNSSYPRVSVAIELSVTTPANATRPVPVIMELQFVVPPTGEPVKR